MDNAPSSPPLEIIHGEPSLPIQAERVQAWLTPRGGMLGPVEFTLPTGRVVKPYSLAPWLPAEYATSQPPLLQVVRGDFFCFPFGADPDGSLPHGEPANKTWAITHVAPGLAELTLATSQPAATIRKRVTVRERETNLYQEHIISAQGRFNYGHHPILYVPAGVTAEVRTSPFSFGQVYAAPAGRPPGERGGLRESARFFSLANVPGIDGRIESLERYPARDGTEDIIMLARFPGPLAWTAVTLDGYVWFSVRRTEDFPGTLFWMSNGGRDAAPWLGRHARRIGIEDVCSHFCDGPAISSRDLLASEGVVTSRVFAPAIPVSLRHIQGVVEVPAGFGGMKSLGPVAGNPSAARIEGENGRSVTFPLDWSFLSS